MQVRIARRCHCVIKNEIDEIYLCKDLAEARVRGNEILDFLHQNNCKAHCFFIRENANEIVVDSKFNVDDIVL